MIRFRLSGLNGWHDCQRRVAFGSLKDHVSGLSDIERSTASHIGSAVGTASHAGAEYLLKAKKDDKIATVTDAEEYAVDEFLGELNNSEFCFDDQTCDRNEAIQQIRQITRIFEAYMLDKLNPLRIEERFNYIMGCVEFSGQIDLQTKDLCLWDLKTSKLLGSFFAQIGGYSIAINKSDIDTGESCNVIHIPRLKIKKAPYVHEVTYGTLDCEKVAKKYMAQIERLFSTFLDCENPNIFNANPSSTLCSNKYCPIFGTEFCSVSRMNPKINKVL